MDNEPDPHLADHGKQEQAWTASPEIGQTKPGDARSRFDPRYWSRRMKAVSIVCLAAIGLAIGLTVALGSSSDIAVHGSLTDTSALTGGSGCGESNGDQVVITDASGKVLAVTTLRENAKMEKKLEADPAAIGLAKDSNSLNALGGGGIAVDVVGYYEFDATVPSGANTYSVKVGSGSAVWFNASEITKGPGLKCS
jgi:hypothetical protein